MSLLKEDALQSEDYREDDQIYCLMRHSIDESFELYVLDESEDEWNIIDMDEVNDLLWYTRLLNSIHLQNNWIA